MNSVALNIDGEIKELESADRFTQFGGEQNSYKGFYVPWETIKRLSTAKSAKILITPLSSGSVVGDFRATDGAMFIDFLPDFIQAVEAALPNDL